MTQIINNRNERVDIYIESTNIKRIREFYKLFYVNTFDNLDKMNRFLEIHKLSKLI